MTSWYASLPEDKETSSFCNRLKSNIPKNNKLEVIGKDNRGPDLHPLSNSPDDRRTPFTFTGKSSG